MAFDPKNLSALTYANGFTLWHYKTAVDTRNTIDTAAYFNAAIDILRVGDLMIITGSDASGLHLVNSLTVGAVDIADALALVATDTR
ncbi:MAG: hypothetical protein ACREB3_05955 [Burkholderiales bacterium]